ncbi:hypothetical protein LAV_00012 [Sphingobium phage Lacusarx]|uniref:Uncharacterized protein n=1 Tax=Sphingobium phage Lacusarx TaxID=1980139 RepID=A0A1W6DXB2_9CAUD|nr:hypothetical protein FDH44_gp012 [Sphingobium phage Lacusarx]ARK07412.1 hypothetical protein LAV_00012 [Sphingobium phage Lacusarx]
MSTDYGALMKRLVADAIKNKMGGLTKTVTFRFFVSAGTYDPDTDSVTPVYEDVSDVVVVAAKPTFDDVTQRNVVFSDMKLLVPGTSIPKEPQTDTDMVIVNNEEWQVRKTVGVPGESLYLVFIHRT